MYPLLLAVQQDGWGAVGSTWGELASPMTYTLSLFLCATCPRVSLSPSTTCMHSQLVLSLSLPSSLLAPSRTIIHVIIMRTGRFEKRYQTEIRLLVWCSFQRAEKIPFIFAITYASFSFVIFTPPHVSLFIFLCMTLTNCLSERPQAVPFVCMSSTPKKLGVMVLDWTSLSPDLNPAKYQCGKFISKPEEHKM